VRILLPIVFLTLLSTAGAAHEIKVGELVIVHPMVDEAEKGQASAQGSLDIRNEGKAADQLLSITSEFAEQATIEAPLPVVVPANGRVAISMRFQNIKRQLSENEVYAGELVFQKAGKVQVDLMVHTHPH
jgi:periplasmic copper chaperone A